MGEGMSAEALSAVVLAAAAVDLGTLCRGSILALSLAVDLANLCHSRMGSLAGYTQTQSMEPPTSVRGHRPLNIDIIVDVNACTDIKDQHTCEMFHPGLKWIFLSTAVPEGWRNSLVPDIFTGIYKHYFPGLVHRATVPCGVDCV